MFQIDWYGNGGRCYPLSGTVESAQCGVCGVQMNVERNVLGPTSYAEAIAGIKHRHDRFVCPRIEETWHKRISELKTGVYLAEINNRSNKNEIKKAVEEEIIKLLEANAAR